MQLRTPQQLPTVDRRNVAQCCSSRSVKPSAGCGACSRRLQTATTGRFQGHASRRIQQLVSTAAGSGTGFDAAVKSGAADQTAAAADAFAQWAQTAGIESPKLRMASFDGVRGMAARQGVAPGDQLVALPREAALLATPGQKCPFPDWVAAGFWDNSIWSMRLALMLLHERRQGNASRVAGYVAQLPRDFDTLLHWSPNERGALQYPHLTREVELQAGRWRELHNELLAASPGCGVSPEELTWALECVYSRAFSGPYSGGTLRQKAAVAGALAVLGAGSIAFGGASLESVLNAGIAAVLFNIIYDSLLGAKLKWHALVPMIDSMNHSSKSQSEVSFEYFRDRFVVEANDPVALNAQAFITYGRQGNDRLLQFYGFVEAGNPADTYVVRDLDAAIEDVVGQPLSATRRTALAAAGLADALEKAVFTRAGPEAAMLAAARAALSPAEPSSAADFQSPAEPRIEALTYQVLVKILEEEQQRLSSTAQPAKASKPTSAGGQRYALAAAFRREKASVLAAALAAMQQQAQTLQGGR